MRKILFYYHHFGGLGHGMRILSICKAIKEVCPGYRLLVINSGLPQPELGIAKFAKVVNLPPFIAKDGLFSGIRSAHGLGYTFRRREKILGIIGDSFNPDIAVFEHFPFGRDPLEQEISSFIIGLRKKKTIIYSSVRDIIGISSLDSRLGARLSLFDGVIVHSDPKDGFITNFRITDGLKRKMFFSGRVFSLTAAELNYQSKPALFYKSGRRKKILISIGGGIDGLEIISKLLEIKTGIDRKYKTLYVISLGPSCNKKTFYNFQWAVKSHSDIIIRRFFSGYLKYVKHADLYISMGGYNSVNNAIFAARRNLIFPRLSDNEQLFRVNLFKNLINRADISWSRQRLIRAITGLLARKPQKRLLPADGAITTARFIERASNLRSLKIRINTRCNCSCDMCSWKGSDQELGLGKIKDILDQASMLNFRTVNFTGGEPTLHPHFFEVIEYAKERGLAVSLSTNGIIGLKRLISFIKNVDFIDISINSHDPKIDCFIRGIPQSLDKSLATIRNIRKIRPAIKIHINVTVRPDNFSQIWKVVTILSGLADSISFTLVDASLKKDWRLIFNSKQLRAFYFTEIPLILKEAIRCKIGTRFNPFFNELNNFSQKKILEELTTKAGRYLSKFGDIFKYSPSQECLKSRSEVRINADGKVSPCCYADDDGQALGNIYKDDLSHILTQGNYYDCISENKKFRFCRRLCKAGYRRYAQAASKV